MEAKTETLYARPCRPCDGTGWEELEPLEEAGLGYYKPRKGKGECPSCKGSGLVRTTRKGKYVREVRDEEELTAVEEVVA